MSYLSLNPSGTPNFTQATISFWFRVPQASIAAAHAAYVGDGRQLDGIIPLVVMGRTGHADDGVIQEDQTVPLTIQDTLSYTGFGETATFGTVLGVCYYLPIGPPPGLAVDRIQDQFFFNEDVTTVEDKSTVDTTITIFSKGAPGNPTNPTCIGVDCSGGTPLLYVNFETTSRPTVANYQIQTTSITPGTQLGGPANPPGPTQTLQGTRTNTYCFFGITGIIPDTFTSTDDLTPLPDVPVIITQPVYNQEDVSKLFLNCTGAIVSDVISVSADVWHHVMISVDCKPILTHGDPGTGIGPTAKYVDSAAHLFVALDDANYTKSNLSEWWPNGSSDPNAVITQNAQLLAGSVNNQNDGSFPTYKLSGYNIPVTNTEIGIPGRSDTVNNIQIVEMAEFQMFTGVALDTSDVGNRRMFIDAHGAPVDPAVPQQLLDMQPYHMFHIDVNWEKGIDTGAALANWDVVGVNHSYSPQPKLGT